MRTLGGRGKHLIQMYGYSMDEKGQGTYELVFFPFLFTFLWPSWGSETSYYLNNQSSLLEEDKLTKYSVKRRNGGLDPLNKPVQRVFLDYCDGGNFEDFSYEYYK